MGPFEMASAVLDYTCSFSLTMISDKPVLSQEDPQCIADNFLRVGRFCIPLLAGLFRLTRGGAPWGWKHPSMRPAPDMGV